MELHVAYVVDDHKIKMDAMRLKIRKTRKYATDNEAWHHYAVGSIVTLVAIMIASLAAFKCFTQLYVSFNVCFNYTLQRAVCCSIRTMYELYVFNYFNNNF